MSKFEELREQYGVFLYRDYRLEKTETGYRVTYFFSIPGLQDFQPVWEFPATGESDGEILRRLVFSLGMVELISYWKCACPGVVEVQCGGLTEEQKKWWIKLMYNGLGEFLYRNGIQVGMDELVEIRCRAAQGGPVRDLGVYEGCLVPVGGGKDSVVSLELLKDQKIVTFSINGNQTTKNIEDLCECRSGSLHVRRTLDPALLELNAKGFLNGHTPFSALVAFASVITAFLNGIRDVALSNETSANETTVKGSFVNHQYSKSYEFEQDFSWYLKSLTDSEIRYFSLLRPLTEIQIAWLFSGCKRYHGAFRSCNVGSKKGIWCCNCPKCLFVYIILSPFLSQEELAGIFGEKLLDKEGLEKDFRELTGLEENKPFECVGTRKEVLVALKAFIEQGGKSILTERYRETILSEPGSLQDMLRGWADENNVPELYRQLLKRRME